MFLNSNRSLLSGPQRMILEKLIFRPMRIAWHLTNSDIFDKNIKVHRKDIRSIKWRVCILGYPSCYSIINYAFGWVISVNLSSCLFIFSKVNNSKWETCITSKGNIFVRLSRVFSRDVEKFKRNFRSRFLKRFDYCAGELLF